jgi:hypothetical protein
MLARSVDSSRGGMIVELVSTIWGYNKVCHSNKILLSELLKAVFGTRVRGGASESLSLAASPCGTMP